MIELTATIATNGNTTITVKGVKGKACKALTKEVEEGLGVVVSDKGTPELYEQENISVSNKA